MKKEVIILKRKVAGQAALVNNSTPKESLPKGEFPASYRNEEVAKYANRNSKKGRQNS